MKIALLLLSVLALAACSPTQSPNTRASIPPTVTGRNSDPAISAQLQANDVGTDSIRGSWTRASGSAPYLSFGVNNFNAMAEYDRIGDANIKGQLNDNGYALWDSGRPVEFGQYEVVYSRFLLLYPKWQVAGNTAAQTTTRCAYISFAAPSLSMSQIALTSMPISSATTEEDMKTSCRANETDRSQVLVFRP